MRAKILLITIIAFVSLDSGTTSAQEITPGEKITLAKALDAADKRNLTIEAIRVEIEKADAQLSRAWGLILPVAQANMTYRHADHEDSVNMGIPGSGAILLGKQENLNGTIQASVPLINLQSWFTISAAKTGSQMAQLSVEQARQEMLAGVAGAYLVALMSNTVVELQQAQIESATHHLAVATRRFEAGTGLRIDVIRAETDLEMVNQDLIVAVRSLDSSRDTLGYLTGLGGLPMPVEITPITRNTDNEDELVEQAISHRPDLAIGKNAVELSRKQLDTTWMQFVPTVDAAWQGTYQFTEPASMGSDDRSRWNAMLTLTIPLYNHFRYAELDERRAVLKQSQIQMEDTQKKASMEVRQARRDYLSALSSVEVADRQVKLAAEGLTLMETAYRAGTGSSLDVTDARRTSISAEVGLVAKRLEAQIALIKLIKSTGEDMGAIAR